MTFTKSKLFLKANICNNDVETNWSCFGIESISFQELLQKNLVCEPFSGNLQGIFHAHTQLKYTKKSQKLKKNPTTGEQSN